MQRESSGALFSYFSNNGNPAAAGSKTGAKPAAPSRAPANRTAVKTMDSGAKPDDAKQDPVKQDKIWRQFLENEQRLDKQWEQNWGFMTEFDPKGNKKVKKPLPEEASIYSDIVPNTDAGNYGSRLSTETGQRMAQMQAKFETENRRSKPDKDIICY